MALISAFTAIAHEARMRFRTSFSEEDALPLSIMHESSVIDAISNDTLTDDQWLAIGQMAKKFFPSESTHKR